MRGNGRLNAGYIQLLEAILLPFMSSMGPEFMFMDDNVGFTQKTGVWPPQGSDLNIAGTF